MRAVVTGSRGHMGEEFTSALTARGYDVTGIDIKAGLEGDAHSFFHNDRTRWDLIVHCAQVQLGDPLEKRYEPFALINAALDTAMWAWVNRTGQSKVIYPSSASVYGETSDHSRETDPLMPSGVIGRIKATNEMLGKLASNESSQFLFPRYFDVFSKLGTTTALDARDVIRESRWSSKPRLFSTGEEIRDYMYIKDAVELTLKVFEGGRSGPVNICSGAGVRAKDFADLALRTVIREGVVPVFDGTHPLPDQVGYNGVMLRYGQQDYTLESAMEDIRATRG
jgi:nucleoside-diphosphate-sugar epimerase